MTKPLFSRLSAFYKRYLAHRISWLLAAALFVYLFILNDNNLYQRYQYDQKIQRLEQEIKDYEEELRRNRLRLQELQMDKDGLERFAREQFHMKRPNEDLFLIK